MVRLHIIPVLPVPTLITENLCLAAPYLNKLIYPFKLLVGIPLS
jgi:hypothetical protein